ncbi:malate dehydrogenase (oxaloacetate-decarboxylating) [Orenia metallireducens]|uniref:Malate dehydrogenase (Oxaloacetate-decarboxylating) n=1 Tax=Orenia metallireducens TaxID=1413210 RepID=A0A285GF61_9FIRM|nr:malic enzyme-like NAD(P)-binding protein [Orenia metallireducens]PRX30370.1 malate dehydrogenase (oxaloacetate-decarboxylating) [Orenia metallireducens]SNY22105.1 malate dehydrogenase (oxaloacetate-decarboxylating) [Orenia metallireducens]
MSLKEEALLLHKKNQGKISVNSKVEVKNREDLTLAYSPGVAEPCLEIVKDRSEVYNYTAKGNLVAVVSDGTAVLGLGDIGPEAAMPVMEGKAVLFKEFAGVDAFPICLNTKDVDEIVETVKRLEPTFGGINLEDISAPRCIEIEERLKKELEIPVFHDDQHGTAIVVLAGLINAAKSVAKELESLKVVVNGAGAAGLAIARLLLNVGIKDIILVDKFGALASGIEEMNEIQKELAEMTNQTDKRGSLGEVIVGMDAFIGVSAPNILTKEMVKSMAEDPIIFAMANPVPEIDPTLAKEAGAKVIGTGRSDYPNQVNNVLAFPGIFKGALKVQAREITEEMKIAAAYGIAELIDEDELSADYVIPNPFNKEVVNRVALEVAKRAINDGLAKRVLSEQELQKEFS